MMHKEPGGEVGKPDAAAIQLLPLTVPEAAHSVSLLRELEDFRTKDDGQMDDRWGK